MRNAHAKSSIFGSDASPLSPGSPDIPLLKIKVVSGSSGNQVVGWLGDTLKIRVTAKPEKGKANDAVIALLSDTLRIPKKSVTISTGARSPQKVIEISGLPDAEIRSRLPGPD
ncbi:MAG: DUF167 domain-containing protein [Woeseia sp.]